ncbi:MAG TPA: hypothetical protein PLT82_05605 [Candidatus Hydrogenedens sp.]|nr:hypothetical protein [Candidatus Hydrogenedens sp.]HOK09341.1 hypothetical protein [Candidatus Hydrogenedens sp.]HOL21159.1 hypothetical protein [Candidatus Hydrogenedens sp.]HPP58589.1 hypothetical protein [Candidatus Hydrogenedens sp.]
MPTIKYYCPNCGKKFVEWGAQKFNFKCPHCRDVQLERIGISSDQIISTPKTRRKPRISEDDVDIEFPEGYGQEDELDDFGGVPDVPILEEEELPLDEEMPPDETLADTELGEDALPPDEELDIEEE